MAGSGFPRRGEMKTRKDYRIAAIFDTETTNIGEGAETRAYPILYIFNDLRDTSLESYTPDTDDVRFYRRTSEALAYIDDLIAYGRAHGYVSIIAAYNLMFDMQTLMLELAQSYTIEVNAQTATSVYTLDLCRDGDVVCRFWDTFYLEMGGLRAMGETCGLPKAVGDWDYSLVRTPETPLTAEELFYARRFYSEPARACRAERVNKAVKKRHSAAKQQYYFDRGHANVDYVKYLCRVSHLRHKFAHGGTGHFRAQNMNGTRRRRGRKYRNDKHKHAHAAYPVRETAPEKQPSAHLFHIAQY